MSATQRLEALAIRAAIAVARRLPYAVSEACGTATGRLCWMLDRRHRRLAQDNVAAAFPDLSPALRRALVRRAFEHFGRLLFALLEFSGLAPHVMSERAEIEGAERVQAAHAVGKGVLFVTGHFGFWEIQALVHALAFPPMTVLARPLDNPVLHEMLERIRTRTGNTVIYRQGSVRRVMRALEAGQGVGILIDQHTLGRDAVSVDFFNRPAATTSAVAALALRTGAPVIPLFALPLGRGRYRLVYEAPVPPPTADDPDPIREFTQRCTDVLETYVRQRPDMWLWMHRRWR
jgi:KDO2-lipid IV(A) lauroyltransferase